MQRRSPAAARSRPRARWTAEWRPACVIGPPELGQRALGPCWTALWASVHQRTPCSGCLLPSSQHHTPSRLTSKPAAFHSAGRSCTTTEACGRRAGACVATLRRCCSCACRGGREATTRKPRQTAPSAMPTACRPRTAAWRLQRRQGQSQVTGWGRQRRARGGLPVSQPGADELSTGAVRTAVASLPRSPSPPRRRRHPRHQLRQRCLRQAVPQALPCGVAQLGWAPRFA